MSDESGEVRDFSQVQSLNRTQQRIAELVAQGYGNRQIASRLNLREQSVRNEVSRIFKKTGIANRVELALRMHGLSPIRTSVFREDGIRPSNASATENE
jgi:DNA-binding NarL/FixJ family response regulator